MPRWAALTKQTDKARSRLHTGIRPVFPGAHVRNYTCMNVKALVHVSMYLLFMYLYVYVCMYVCMFVGRSVGR